MRELYREGLASHSGPEPCEGSRKAALEALDRGSGRQGCESCGVKVPVPSIAYSDGKHIRCMRR